MKVLDFKHGFIWGKKVLGWIIVVKNIIVENMFVFLLKIK